MNVRLRSFIETYSELERGVQELVSAQCGPVCGLCTVACCCRADICEEALESPFLRLLHGQKELESDAYGFLTENGCALKLGRPPICYEFFCEELLEAQPDDQHRDLLKILGRLPTHAGENARGESHLVEIMQEEELDHLAFHPPSPDSSGATGRLGKQMQECFQALEVLRVFFNEETLPAGADRVLSRITLAED